MEVNLFQRELMKIICSAGIPMATAERAAECYCGELLRDHGSYAFEFEWLPNADCVKTLKEAQRIAAGQETDSSYFEIGEYQISKLMKVPFTDVQDAKREISMYYHKAMEEVDRLYDTDVNWLFVKSSNAAELASFLSAQLTDKTLEWRIFANAALLSFEKAKERILTVKRMLGDENGIQLLRADVRNWLFYPHFTDPIGGLQYLLDSGLSSAQVVDFITSEPDYLFDFKEGKQLKYLHNQELIDYKIEKHKK